MLSRLTGKTPLKNDMSSVYRIEKINIKVIEDILSSRFIEEGVFALETFIENGQMENYLVAPSFSLFDYKTAKERCKLNREDVNNLDLYEIALTKNALMPLNTKKYINIIQKMTELADTPLFTQILICERQGDWREHMIDQYDLYRKGVDNPSESAFLLKFQNRIIDKINTVRKIQALRKTAQEIEDKILQPNYRFEMRIVLFRRKEERCQFRINVESELKELNLFNELKLQHIKDKLSFVDDIVSRRFRYDSVHQFLSYDEMFSLFCYRGSNANTRKTIAETITRNQEDIYESNPINYVSSTTQNTPLTKSDRESILPLMNNDVDQSIDEGALEQIQHAFKRVGVTNQKLNVLEVVNGATLYKLKIEIPSKINFNDIHKHLKNIQAAMGNEFISIEIGTDPGTIDLFIPKQERRLIYLGNALKSASFQKYASKAILPIVLGENTSGELMSICLTEIVHLLVAGATGSGKSVFLHNIITSLLLNVNPDLLRMILIDPKANEMLTYNGIPHVNVITDMNQSFKTLESLCIEMDKRYELLGKHGYRNIKQYNNNSEKKLSYIVCVIDEYADLMMTNSEVEDYIVRLAQKARASGIHLIIATQKPLATVVTSLLKTNLPSAIGFKMKTSQDYMTVFGKGIPYRLFGKGDGVAMIEGQLKEFERFQSPLITADENEEIGVFNKLRESFGNMKIASEPAVPEIVKEEEPIDKLRKIIATTGETRVTKLRELMGIRINVVQELIQQLASEGFLKKENNKYEVTATEEELNNYRNEEYDK